VGEEGRDRDEYRAEHDQCGAKRVPVGGFERQNLRFVRLIILDGTLSAFDGDGLKCGLAGFGSVGHLEKTLRDLEEQQGYLHLSPETRVAKPTDFEQPAEDLERLR